MLDEKKNNYIASIIYDKKECAIAFCDVSTGEFFVSSVNGYDVNIKIINEISRISPSEIVLPEKTKQNSMFLKDLNKYFDIYISSYNDLRENEFLNNMLQKSSDNISSLECEASKLLLIMLKILKKLVLIS